MICPKCKKEYSPKVCKIHIRNCKSSESELDVLRASAKAQGIERYWLKSAATLKAELLKGGYDVTEGS